jgi:hypothetical protein
VSRDFRPSVFSLKQYSLGPWFTGYSLFEFCFVFAEIWSIFERKSFCLVDLLTSIFFSVGVGQFGKINVLIAILFKSSRAPRIVRRCTMHAVSMTPHASCMRCHWARMHFFAEHRRFAYDFSKLFENFTVHAVSITPHAPCIRCQWHRMHVKKFE